MYTYLFLSKTNISLYTLVSKFRTPSHCPSNSLVSLSQAISGCLTDSLPVSPSLKQSQSLMLILLSPYLSHSLSHNLSACLTISLTISACPTLYLTIFLLVPFYLTVFLIVSLSTSQTFWLSHSLPHNLCLSHSNSKYLLVSLSSSLSLYLSHPLSHYPFARLTLYLTISASVSQSISSCLTLSSPQLLTIFSIYFTNCLSDSISI